VVFRKRDSGYLLVLSRYLVSTRNLAFSMFHFVWVLKNEWLVAFSSPEPRSFWPAAGIESSGRTRFLSMRRVFVSYSQPIRFARFDGKSVNRGLPVLEKARALDPCRRSEWSWALGTRMGLSVQFSVQRALIVPRPPSSDHRACEICLDRANPGGVCFRLSIKRAL